MILAVSILGNMAPLVRAQVVGSALSGTVRDASGGALPEASVTIKNVETGAERKLVTDAGGRYYAPSITVGRYEITASKEGFTAQTKTGVELVVGQSSVVDLALPVGVLEQEITVEEAPAPVTLSTQQSSGLVSERQVKDLPLNGRSYDGLLTLNPGILNYTAERSGGVGTSNAAVGNMYVISGHRAQENLFLLNGIEYTGASEINLTPGGASGQLLGVEAVREFNVVTDTYGVEYGKRSGGQISIVTASGTNQLHGSVYEFLRNSDLDARNFFDQGSIPQFQRNDFGAALGGPIQKDKTFLFGNYEGFRQHLALSDVTFVPDNAARQGIVSGVNVGITPAASALLSLWPVQNGPDLGGGIGEAFSHPLQTIREDFGTLRLDHNFSEKDTLFGVYTADDSADNTPTANPLALVVENLREQVLSLQEQHVFSATLLNTSRVGFSRGAYYFNGATPVDIPGWVTGDPIGAVVVGGGTASNGASQITGAGTNAGDNLRIVRNLYTYDDHVTFTHGIHQFDVGGWIQQIQANDNMAQDQYGQASFTSLTTFLQGTIATFTVVPTPTPLSWRSVEGAGFAQDVIKLRRNLELRIGFRFESTNGWNETHDRAANYLFQNGVIDTNPQVGSSAFTVNRAKFLPDPRAGLAWDPFGKGKTVIRAGFGFYRALLDDLDYRLDQIGPFNTTLAAKSVSLTGLQVAPGAASIPKGQVVPSGIQPGSVHSDGGFLHLQNRADDRSQYVPRRGVLGLARLSRAAVPGRERACGDDLPRSLVPCRSRRWNNLLSGGRGASQPESRQHDILVHRGHQLLQCADRRRESPLRSWPAIQGRVHLREESGRWYRAEQQRRRECPRIRHVSAGPEDRLGPRYHRRPQQRGDQRHLRTPHRARQAVLERPRWMEEKTGGGLEPQRHWNHPVRLPLHAAARI